VVVVLEGLLPVVAYDVQFHEDILHKVEEGPNIHRFLEMVHNPSNLAEAEGHGNSVEVRHIHTGEGVLLEEEVDLYRTVVVRHFHTHTGMAQGESLARAHRDAATAALSIIHAWSKSADDDDDSIRLEIIRTLLKAAVSGGTLYDLIAVSLISVQRKPLFRVSFRFSIQFFLLNEPILIPS
jgi:hypothetical protein